ncbi:hypothetical protein H696_04000 [Fonticula alba]|uniref:GP-PDE domain-containing protein n=1 Tax=Fonticula alba TaxID=691883 RepID=A0A058Z6N5_FONAL|nr:hypothetical protein H696_04000 [Fonticula alba]KCV69578.1 hypothetical protein H696_04000 [Fonticula alba]|eukprot:XP_009496143.1 hypothetical protein H696_04000 [Fonticula alba]
MLPLSEGQAELRVRFGVRDTNPIELLAAGLPNGADTSALSVKMSVFSAGEANAPAALLPQINICNYGALSDSQCDKYLALLEALGPQPPSARTPVGPFPSFVPTIQPEFGVPWSAGDSFEFTLRLQEAALKQVFMCFEIFSAPSGPEGSTSPVPMLLASATVTPGQFAGKSADIIEAALLSAGCPSRPAGRLRADVLIGRALPASVLALAASATIPSPGMQADFPFTSLPSTAGSSADELAGVTLPAPTYGPVSGLGARRVGHRGAGASDRNVSPSPAWLSPLRENTLLSLLRASRNGADGVEFDVLLSKCKQVVVYHNTDARVRGTVRSDGDAGAQGFEDVVINLNQMSTKQLRSLHLGLTGEVPGADGQPADLGGDPGFECMSTEPGHGRAAGTVCPINQDPNASGVATASGQASTTPCVPAPGYMPSLQQLFDTLPPGLMFNIEIKFPTPAIVPDEVNTFDQWADRNFMLDEILRVALAPQPICARPIVISSFDPEICYLARLKQSAIPVIFLTTGGHPVYGAYGDVRSMSVAAAISFARVARLHGVCSFTAPLVEQPELITLVKKFGLSLFTWGSHNNDAKEATKARSLGVDGIISDLFHLPQAPTGEATLGDQ